MCTTIKTSKEECNKQLLEQREENQKLNVKLKTEIDSGTKIKILDKEHQGENTRVKESEIRPKGIEEEKERMISCFKEDIKERETSKVDSGRQLILKRQETNESSNKLKMKIDLNNKLQVLSKERQEERKSTESHRNNMLFDKERSNNERLTNEDNNNDEENVGATTQTKSVINENKDNLLLECDHEINNYKHYKHNNKKYKEKYTALSIKKHENTTNAKESHNHNNNTTPPTKKITLPTSRHSRGKDRYQSIIASSRPNSPSRSNSLEHPPHPTTSIVPPLLSPPPTRRIL